MILSKMLYNLFILIYLFAVPVHARIDISCNTENIFTVPGIIVNDHGKPETGEMMQFTTKTKLTFTGKIINTNGIILIENKTIKHFRLNTSIYTYPWDEFKTRDIESISILKDADATAIYGSTKTNGAILIVTKKGKTGKIIFNSYLQEDNTSSSVPIHSKANRVNIYIHSYPLSFINPPDIKSIVVLKDTDATVTCNVKGKFGPIFIPTKWRQGPIINLTGNTNYNYNLEYLFSIKNGIISRKQLLRCPPFAVNYILDNNWYKKKRKTILDNTLATIRENKCLSFRAKIGHITYPLQHT